MNLDENNRENMPEKPIKEWFEKGIDGEWTLCNECEIGEEQILRFLVNRRPACAKNLSERGLLAARGWVVKSGSHIWCLAPSRLWCLTPALSVATLDHG